jgi:hypothetical protein
MRLGSAFNTWHQLINMKTTNKEMKSIITLSVITALAALAWGCSPGGSGNSPETQTANSSASDTNAMAAATNSVPSTNTNTPAGTNQ